MSPISNGLKTRSLNRVQLYQPYIYLYIYRSVRYLLLYLTILCDKMLLPFLYVWTHIHNKQDFLCKHLLCTRIIHDPDWIVFLYSTRNISFLSVRCFILHVLLYIVVNAHKRDPCVNTQSHNKWNILITRNHIKITYDVYKNK